MSDATIPLVLLGGGVAYVALRGHGESSPPGGTRYGAGSQPGATRMQLTANPTIIANALRIGLASGSIKPVATTGNAGGGNWTDQAENELKQKLDLMEAAAKKQFDNADAVAKGAAADYLNKELKLDPPLTGHESWETVSSVVGGAAGAAAGAWIGGPWGAKVGALVGAYLGAEAAEYLHKGYDEVKEWVTDKYGDVKGWVKGAAGDVKDWTEDAIDYIGGLF